MFEKKLSEVNYCILVLLILCICFLGKNVSPQQRNVEKLNDAETIVNKKCESSAQVIEAFSLVKTADIFLLMDEEYFTKSEMSRLFTCISKEYPKVWLDITAFSDKKNLDIAINNYLYPPLDANPPIRSEYHPAGIGYYRAYYSRFEKEYFKYSPDSQKYRMVTVNLKK